MKCPNCNAEVKKGSLYCDKCLAEIPWVKEFNSVETLMEKKKIEKPEEHLSIIPGHSSFPKVAARKKRFRKVLGGKRKGVIFCVFFLLIVLLIYRQLNTFSALYQRGERAYLSGDYENALTLAEKALDKKPDHLKTNLLRAKILEAEGDVDSAILVLKPVLSHYPDSVNAYKMMLRLLNKKGKTGEIKKLLSACKNPEILKECSEYISKEPSSGLESGTYTTKQKVELFSEGGTIYYTMDGKKPTEKSLIYSEPITLLEGTTVLKAISVNGKGIPSSVMTWEYVLVYGVPDPPKVYPESGNYNKRMKIELEVPDGCVAYYAFDEEPTVKSTQYQNPISMPVGYHEFYAILESANGEVSEFAYREYYLEY